MALKVGWGMKVRSNKQISKQIQEKTKKYGEQTDGCLEQLWESVRRWAK